MLISEESKKVEKERRSALCGVDFDGEWVACAGVGVAEVLRGPRVEVEAQCGVVEQDADARSHRRDMKGS